MSNELLKQAGIHTNGKSPVREYRIVVDENGHKFMNRVMIGTAVTGLVRIEWVAARYGQIIPMNWSYIYLNQYISAYMPLRYQVADAQNLIVKEAINKDIEWLLLIEHDVVLPPDAFIKFNQYMINEDTPVVSGLYFLRGRPSYPLIFRGRGNSIYTKWKMGDKVWVDGVPTGCLLIHMGIIREMWKDSEEYTAGGQVTRKVFNQPLHLWSDPEDPHNVAAFGGTSDLDWCTRVIEGDYLKKAGWTDIACKKYPLLMDTSIFCQHINPDGEMFPGRLQNGRP